MATHGRGLICLALTPDRCDELRLPQMSPLNTSNFGTAFCESIDEQLPRHRWSSGGPAEESSVLPVLPTPLR